MNNDARQAILGSIRTHLAASVPFDKRELQKEQVQTEQEQARKDGLPPLPDQQGQATRPDLFNSENHKVSLVDSFKLNLEAVGVRCVIAQTEADIGSGLTQIISALQKTPLRAQRIAISNAPQVERFLYETDLEIEELGIAPNASDIFRFDIGITSAQAAIAESGTLVLDSVQERHRFVSLVPPVHIAIINASSIFETLGEALTSLHKQQELSPAVTFITGPSRTADIELTLTVGVHGPQELYVIINGSA
jgi:L-lactate dehydrogenase complex protein LldG